MAKLTTICPVCENDISIESRDIKLAVMQKGKTAGKTIIGCPACARVLDCPWSEEFEMEWRRGRLAKAIPYIVFHADDMTYSGGA